MIRIKSLAVIGALALATAACGDRPVDRALTGGAIGAGGGALIGAAAGNPWAGAAVSAPLAAPRSVQPPPHVSTTTKSQASGDRRCVVHVEPADVGDRAVA